MKPRISLCLAAPLLLLAGCEEEVVEADTSATGGKAVGEVLGGTISDEMIPLQELTSTSPPAERPAAVSGGAAPAAGEASEAETQGAETQETGTSEDTPAPEPADEE